MAAHQLPKYEKVISQNDLNTLCVPSSIRGHVWEENAEHGTERFVGVVDNHGNRWNWRGRMRINVKGDRKPEVNGEDWKRFVKDKQLRVFDKIVFERIHSENDPMLIFRVSVSRKLPKEFRLFGADFRHGPANE